MDKSLQYQNVGQKLFAQLWRLGKENDTNSQQILTLELKMIKLGQYKISRALIWGKVGLCRQNMTGDMIKK